MAASPHSDSSYPHDDGRKRVAKACDRCRLKKIKCDGKIPCSRCQSENQICQFGERKKSIERRIPAGYVEYLEDQQKVLVKALKKTWQQQHHSAPRAHLREGGEPDIHTIIKDLGVLADFPSHRNRRDGAFWFEEDNEKARRQFEEAEFGDAKSQSPLSGVKREDTPMVDSPLDEYAVDDIQLKLEQSTPAMARSISQDFQSQYALWGYGSRTQTPYPQPGGAFTPQDSDFQDYPEEPQFVSVDYNGETMNPGSMFMDNFEIGSYMGLEDLAPPISQIRIPTANA